MAEAINEVRKEYIEREMANQVLEKYMTETVNDVPISSNTKELYLVAKDHAIEFLSIIPAAEVVEVVRCKNCEHWGGVAFGFICRKFSGIETKICMSADHFCSYGERKSNGEAEE